MRLNKLKLSLILIASAALALAALSFAPFTDNYSFPNNAISDNTFNFVIDFGGGELKKYINKPFNSGEDLFAITKETAEKENLEFDYKEYAGLGNLVVKIGNKENGENGKYWQYWINDKYAEFGSSAYMVRPGDKIEWRFTNEQENLN